MLNTRVGGGGGVMQMYLVGRGEKKERETVKEKKNFQTSLAQERAQQSDSSPFKVTDGGVMTYFLQTVPHCSLWF